MDMSFNGTEYIKCFLPVVHDPGQGRFFGFSDEKFFQFLYVN